MIELRLKARLSVRQIARDLKRRHRVVQYELKNHALRDGSYSAVYAQTLVDQKKLLRSKRGRKLDRDLALQIYVVEGLRSGRSPDLIAGRLKADPPKALKGRTISHESVYAWIQEGEGRYLGLHRHLLSGRPRRQRRHGRKKRKTHIPQRISIHMRPQGIGERRELGHWESDSMVFSKQKTRLSVQHERKTRYVMIHRLSNGSAEETERALVKSIESFPQPVWKSITFDNGGEGASHFKLRQAYGLQTFFCDPYASYQKGGVENANRIIRRFLPRNTDMNQITQRDIYEIQEKINSTPRKILGYRTPKEAMAENYDKGVAHC
jgi:IS30 family transposase